MSGELAPVVDLASRRRQPQRLLTLAELQERFGFSERWWRYRIAEGLPRHKWGAGLRFDADEVKQWLEEHYAA